MRDGIDIVGSPVSAAHVLVLTAQGSDGVNGRTKLRGGMGAISRRPMSPR